MYTRLIIYYFSGTGNAKRAAQWIGDYATKNGISSSLINIGTIDKSLIENPGNNTLIGFCYPTHGFNAPPILIRFLCNFPKSKNNVFLVNTRAGMKLSKIFTPGVSGLALFLPALILLLKGYKIIGLRPLDLPSNWISLHPALRGNAVSAIFTRCKKIIDDFSGKIFTNKNVYRGLYDLPIDILISPIAIGYYFYGRFALAKTFITSNKCNLCEACIKNCPVQAITFVDQRPFWSINCESCMQCMNQCPHNAIETAHAYVVVIWWIAFSIIPYYVTFIFTKTVIASYSFTGIMHDLIYNVFSLGLGFICFVSGYKILHFLMKFRFFNKLILITSLTSFKFWGRYKVPRSF